MAIDIWILPVVMGRTGLSESAILAKVADGVFPEPIYLGGRDLVWIADEVIGWLSRK